jgi:hypothetical protein
VKVALHISDYKKGDMHIFDLLKGQLDTAIDNAKRLEAENATTNSDNPGTQMHHLVEYLRALKRG